jgi:hypothetical protein
MGKVAVSLMNVDALGCAARDGVTQLHRNGQRSR